MPPAVFSRILAVVSNRIVIKRTNREYRLFFGRGFAILKKSVRRRTRKGKRNYAQQRTELQEDDQMKYECVCGYVYDPEVGDPDNGIAPGTAFEDLPEDWVCPVCGLEKDAFTAI